MPKRTDHETFYCSNAPQCPALLPPWRDPLFFRQRVLALEPGGRQDPSADPLRHGESSPGRGQKHQVAIFLEQPEFYDAAPAANANAFGLGRRLGRCHWPWPGLRWRLGRRIWISRRLKANDEFGLELRARLFAFASAFFHGIVVDVVCSRRPEWSARVQNSREVPLRRGIASRTGGQ